MTTIAITRLTVLCGLVAGMLCASQSVSGQDTNELRAGGWALDQSEFLVEVWDTDRGLPHSSVTSLAQTPDGYLWVGTQHGGLARFDGARFVAFHPGNTPELPSIEIYKLMVDAQGTLWIGTAEGAILSLRDGRMRFECANPETPPSWLNEVLFSGSEEVCLASVAGHVFRRMRGLEPKPWTTVQFTNAAPGWCITRDADGGFWYRGADTRLRRANSAGQLAEIPQSSGLRGQSVQYIRADDQQRVWISTSQELAMWDGGRFVDQTPINDGPTAFQDFVFSTHGTMWVRTPGRIRKWDARRWVAEMGGMHAGRNFQPGGGLMCASRDGGLWLLNQDDAVYYADAQGRTVRIGPEQGLPQGAVKAWLEDAEGNIWLGFAGGGLARIRRAVFHRVWPEGAERERAARSVCEDAEGAIWFGSSGSRVLRWRDGEFSQFNLPVVTAVAWDLAVCPDAAGRLWVGTAQNGLLVRENDSFIHPFSPEAIGTVVRALYGARDGQMWIGNEFGLFSWHQGKLKSYTEADGFLPAYVVAIAEDQGGGLWLGTAVGELRHYQDGKFTSYRPEDGPGRAGLLASALEVDPMAGRGRGTLSGGERFWALHVDQQGTVWIGSLGGGLLRFKDGRFTRYTPQQGLPGAHVNQILEDDAGHLWLGMRDGVAQIAKAQLEQYALGERAVIESVVYGRFDGLPSVECSGGLQPGCWRDRAGRLWFTTAKGAVWVRPGDVMLNRRPPPVVIEEVWVDGVCIGGDTGGHAPSHHQGNRQEPSPVVASAQILIAPGRHYFEFKFTALSFTSPDKVRYKWRMEGLETDWVDGGTRRSVSYSFLPPGEYAFRVQACNNDGVWNEQGAMVRLTVQPAYWQTGWFRLGVIFLLVASLFGLHRLKVGRMRVLERLRLRIARDLHDEVGANLGSISLLAQVMEKKPAVEDASMIRGIASQTVDTLRDIVWFIDPAHDRLSDLVARMHETAKALLHEIPMQFEQSGDFSTVELPLNFHRNALPIFKEALHNIVKHSGATRVEIAVRRHANDFELHIHDNGIGFNPQARSSGNGLKNLKRRTQEMPGELLIESQPGQGTTLTLRARIP